MNAALLAAISAVFFGIGMTFVKKATGKKPSPLNAVITFCIAATITWIAAIISQANMPDIAAWPYFIAAGILAPGLSAIFNFEGIKRVGIAFATPLIATAPIFSTTLAIIFLQEEVNTLIILGTFIIIFGVFLLTFFRQKKRINLADLKLPFFAAAFVGTATTISKIGLNISNFPFGGIAIAITAGAITQIIVITFLKRWKNISRTVDDFKYFIFAGLSIGTALTIFFYALSIGKVSVVFPINTTQTLFAFIFTWIFLRDQDFISLHTFLGAITVVLGAVLVGLGG